MEDNDHIGARLDRLPLSRFHFRIFGIISFGLLLTGFLSYSGNVVLAKLINNGWSNNYLNAAFTSALMLGYFYWFAYRRFYWGLPGASKSVSH
ncbi:membrane transport protein [Salmonella enterica subsp. enterica]|nr:membrane transport protein [Salmonella enterica subsp. enterica]